MYRSKEIRWFTTEENKQIIRWFSQYGLNFDTIEPRTDTYLIDYPGEDMAPKIREGNMEIKYRVGLPVTFQLSPTATGYMEDWIKWTFRLDERDLAAQSKETMKVRKPYWLEVQKERMGLKISREENNDYQIHSINDFSAQWLPN